MSRILDIAVQDGKNPFRRKGEPVMSTRDVGFLAGVRKNDYSP
jgi:hypothetical protein